jgi:hypothetical protein
MGHESRELDRPRLAVREISSRLHIAEARSSATVEGPPGWEPRPIVFDIEAKPPPFARRAHEEGPRRRVSRDRVMNRVLHERLKHETRDERAFGAIAHLERGRHAVAESNALDVEIPVDEIELTRERHHRIRRRIECFAQQIRETDEHPMRGLGICQRKRRRGMKRIEEEVRLELHPQRAELRARELGL